MAKGTVRWLGHAMCEFVTAEGKVVLFDPWTKDDGNLAAVVDLADIKKADLVAFSHDHFDHMISAAAICRKTGAQLGGSVQTLRKLQASGFPLEQSANSGRGYMPGGGVHYDWLDLYATPAIHSSDTGCAMGSIVVTPDGTSVYHAGDTSLFSEMELYAKLYPIDLAFLPIGGLFTMDANQASVALTMLKPKACVPIHYRSFPMVAQDAGEFLALAQKRAPEVKVLPLEPGEVFDLASL
jgi:L-ascorbate metabolism protein UlaG (beta-lactamase superfamily)